MKPVANGEHGTLPHEEKRNPWGKSRNQDTDSTLLCFFLSLALCLLSLSISVICLLSCSYTSCHPSVSLALHIILLHHPLFNNSCCTRTEWLSFLTNSVSFRFFFYSRINCSLTPRAGICWERLDLFDVGKGSGLYCVLMLTVCEQDRLQRSEREMAGPRSALSIRALGLSLISPPASRLYRT